MNPSTRIRELYEQANIQIDPEVDQRILATAYDRLDHVTQSRPNTRRLKVWRFIMHSKYGRIAALAAILIAVLILAQHLTGGPLETPQPTLVHEINPTPAEQDTLKNTLLSEQGLSQALYEQKDLPGLLTLLETGQEATRLNIAEFLAEIGDASVIPALQKLADVWDGPVQENPFVQAIEVIQLRLDEQAGASAPVEPTSLMVAPAESSLQLTGVVTDISTGRPISGAFIGFNAKGTLVTDSEGFFSLSYDASWRQVSVFVRAEGFASKKVVVQLDKAELPQVSVALGPGATVVGVVRTKAGQAVTEASVEVWPSVGPPMLTDRQGGFSVGGLDAMVRTGLYTVRVTHPDYPFTSTYFSPPAAGETVYQEVILNLG